MLALDALIREMPKPSNREQHFIDKILFYLNLMYHKEVKGNVSESQ